MRRGAWYLSLVTAGLCWSAATAAAVPAPQAAAARLLTQASFGPTAAEITSVVRSGNEAWLQQQFDARPSLHRPELDLAVTLGNEATHAQRQEIWWRHAITAPDQLRQRVAFALSQILVVSDIDPQLQTRPLVTAEYYDILVRGAFDNYRTLLENVTLSPAMGLYLSMIHNAKPAPSTGRRPDENFAREIMQLFSIGLWQLNVDGTFQRDGNGARIPTYDQDNISQFARVYTGWAWADGTAFYANGNSYAPMKAYEDYHDTDAKTLLNGAALPAGQSAAQDLKGALDNLFNHPNVGPFLARRLIQRLVGSNPSPAYVARVAQVFNNNGSGVRGDLRAVVRAILLDAEARTPPQNTGKLREPLLRLAAVWRAFKAAAADGKYKYDNPEREWGQAALRAPSVFNFYSPDFQPSGALSDAGLYAPEFQVQTESRSVTLVNAWTRFVRQQSACSASPQLSEDRATVMLDLCEAAQLAANPAALVDHLDLLMLAGRMPDGLRRVLLDHLQKVPAGDGTQRAAEAIFLVAVSATYSVQR